MHHNNYHFWFILRSTWMYHYSIIHLLIYQPRSLTTRLSISCTVFNLALMFFQTEINICSTLKEMRNLCIFGIERHCHTFHIISLGDWIVHTLQASQTNSVDCDLQKWSAVGITKELHRLGTNLLYSKNGSFLYKIDPKNIHTYSIFYIQYC